MLDTGEDVNGNSLLDTYGGIPNYNGSATVQPLPTGAAAPLDAAATPTTFIGRASPRSTARFSSGAR